MKQILVLCPHPENVAPGQRLKYEQYFDFLRANGYDITVSPFMTMRFWSIVYEKGRIGQKVFWVLFGYLRRIGDLIRAPRYDGVYLFLNATPFGTSLFERLFRLASKRIIYDIDDLVFLGRVSKVNRMIAWLKRPGKYFYMMKCADHVITCTPYLDELVRKYNPNTTDISSTIRTDTYVPTNDYSNSRELVLGWSGSYSTSPYLKLLEEPLRKLKEKHPFKLLVIGDPKFELRGIKVEAISWKEATEVKDLQRIDIGLYPLPDEQWVQGKSGLKALQYMALGIPTVATAIGSNFRIIEDGVNGFLVKTNGEWVDRLERLILNPDLRAKIGRSARHRVEKYFSVKANAPVYLRIFRSVFG